MAALVSPIKLEREGGRGKHTSQDRYESGPREPDEGHVQPISFHLAGIADKQAPSCSSLLRGQYRTE